MVGNLVRIYLKVKVIDGERGDFRNEEDHPIPYIMFRGSTSMEIFTAGSFFLNVSLSRNSTIKR